MTFAIYSVAAIYTLSIVFVAVLVGGTLWSERRAARGAVTMPTEPAAEPLAEDGHRTSVA
ncbi:hypothetical protein HJ588_08160 [Flexivirga sp. ID2601S]|uniref:Heme exporter protein D n=1 Tax=Flexivirga aerilata TaxID=1656889 RepID=A0A849AI69_9MICO|nr:hypothetical protein [Flexivirga aerilata]NNG39246.1 hypothetical protein [Flexivirga aerilata]